MPEKIFVRAQYPLAHAYCMKYARAMSFDHAEEHFFARRALHQEPRNVMHSKLSESIS